VSYLLNNNEGGAMNDIDIDLPQIDQIRLLKLYAPILETECHFIEGETAEEMGAALAINLIIPKRVNETSIAILS
jgi:hypothetical protein